MKLPYRNNVIIPDKKLTDYLLSVIHPEGQSKARLLRSWGFNKSNNHELKGAFRKIVRTRKVVSSRPSDDRSGINYVIDGKIIIPIGGVRKIRTIWYIKHGSRKPRFITAIPLK